MSSNLRVLLYYSELAPGFHSEHVANLLIRAREMNERFDETGMLLFDGQRFAQWVEGDAVAVRRLLDNLLRDDRHVHMRILAYAPVPGRRFEEFRMGYMELGGLSTLQRFQQYTGARALIEFQDLAARLFAARNTTPPPSGAAPVALKM